MPARRQRNDPIVLDINRPEYAVSGIPAETLRRVREVGGVCPVASGGWYVGSAEGVTATLQDVDGFVSVLNPGGAVIPEDEKFLPEIPEPRHARLRRLVNSQFGPQRISRVEPFVRDLCARLMRPLVESGGGDLVAGYTFRIPLDTVAHFCGVELDRAAEVLDWSQEAATLRRQGLPPADVTDSPTAHYVNDLIRVRRRLPAEERPDDMLSRLVAADVDGEPLSDAAIRGQLQSCMATVFTTRTMLGNLLLYLLGRPERYSELRANRHQVPLYLEEILRWSPPSFMLIRRCTRDTRVGDQVVHEGEIVRVGIASANRDESRWEDPDEFLAGRDGARSHFAFGAGPHVCPGATLARAEGVIAIDTFLDAVVSYRAVPGVNYDTLPSYRQEHPRALPVIIEG